MSSWLLLSHGQTSVTLGQACGDRGRAVVSLPSSGGGKHSGTGMSGISAVSSPGFGSSPATYHFVLYYIHQRCRAAGFSQSPQAWPRGPSVHEFMLRASSRIIKITKIAIS